MKSLSKYIFSLALAATFLVSASAQVRINEVDYLNNQIELFNNTASTVDVSTLWLCAAFVYRRIDNGAGLGPPIGVVSGPVDYMLGAGQFIVLSWDNLNDAGTGLGLYNNNNFALAASMEDFVQYITSGNGREDVADTKGIWTAGTTVPGVAAGKTISYFGPGVGVGAWGASEPTLGAVNAALPVELLHFHAVVSEFAVHLSWATASESSNVGFGVERRSSDTAGRFVEIDFIPGGGSTSSRRDYSYTISRMDPGGHAFRLRQVNADGTVAYSGTTEVSVLNGNEVAVSAAYPNPSNGSARLVVSVSKTQPITVDLYDMSGRRVETLLAEVVQGGSSYEIELDGSNLPGGLYVLRVVAGATFREARTIAIVR